MAGTAGPVVNVAVDGFPSAQIEIPDAEIGALRNLQRLLQGGEQGGFDVVEDARHRSGTGHTTAF
jgi:hypothetical protein